MPSFHGKLPDYQVWQIAAYVRSMSGQANHLAAPSREDNMQTGQPETSRKKEQIRNSSNPAGGEMPQ
jgi:cytochrome c oxidase cbb3-type subunit 3